MKKSYAILLALTALLLSPKSFAAGGPDAYGYTWTTSLDAGGPAFNWVDITAKAGVQTVSGLADDNSATGMINVGFNFHYYWNDYSQLKIGSNGWMSFDNVSNQASCFNPTPTAGGGGDNLLAAFMSDLNFTGAGNTGQVKYWTNNIDSCVISYLNVPFWTVNAPGYVGGNTFQVILCGADSSITFQYGTIGGGFTNNGACIDMTVGIENSNGQIGLQVHSDAIVPSNYVIRFDYPAVPLISIQDITPVWNTNSDNKAIFIPATVPHQLITDIKNVGNSAVSTTINLQATVLDAASATVHTSSATLPDLAAGDDSIVEYPSPWIPATTGQYTLRSATTNSQDINAGNNTNDTELDVVDLCNSSLTLSYVTGGIPNGSVNWNGGANDDGAAVYFAPPVYPYTVSSMEFYISSNVNNGFTAQVYDDDGVNGGPGTLLSTQTIPSSSVVSSAWNTVIPATSVTLNDGGFYIVWLQGGTTIFLGTETAGPRSRRNYEILDGGWAEYRDNPTKDILIRTTISGYSSLPVAGFSQTADHLDADFTGTSTGPSQSWQWNFGDGNTSTEEHPSHTYAAPGDYSVCLITSTPCGNDTICQSLTVCDDATAAYSSTANGLTTDFTNESASADSWLWDLGDGNTSTQQNPSHTYAAAGTYNVCLIAENNCGYNDTICQSVTVCLVPAAGYSTTANELSVDFTDATSGNPDSWAWDFGDGNTSTQQHPSHTYATAGTYNVCLIITNGCGYADTTCQTVTVCETLVADFTFNTTDLTVQPTEQSSGNPSTYFWDFGDGNTDTQQNPSHTYGAAGTYTVCLVITNTCGEADTICQQVTVDLNGLSENGKLLLNAYPNPTEDVLHIAFASELQHVTLEVTDLTGKIIWSAKGFSGESIQINAAEWSAGFYKVRVTNATGTGVLTFVKK